MVIGKKIECNVLKCISNSTLSDVLCDYDCMWSRINTSMLPTFYRFSFLSSSWKSKYGTSDITLMRLEIVNWREKWKYKTFWPWHRARKRYSAAQVFRPRCSEAMGWGWRLKRWRMTEIQPDIRNVYLRIINSAFPRGEGRKFSVF